VHDAGDLHDAAGQQPVQPVTGGWAGQADRPRQRLERDAAVAAQRVEEPEVQRVDGHRAAGFHRRRSAHVRILPPGSFLGC
jgi:hypothetical protein